MPDNGQSEADFIQGLLKKNEIKLVRSYSFTVRYIDDVLSLNKPKFGDFVDQIYPIYNKGYIPPLIRYSRACGSYQDFLDIWLLIATKPLNQRFLLVKLKSSL